jgi:hypothetical protein
MNRPALELRHDTSWARHLDSLEFGAESTAWRGTSKPVGIQIGILTCGALAALAALLEAGASHAFAGRTLDAAMFAMLLPPFGPVRAGSFGSSYPSASC